MAKLESLGGSVLPAAALFAGLISGTLLRPNVQPEQPHQPNTAVATTSPTTRPADESGPRLSDMRPVLELLSEALGVSINTTDILRALAALRLDAERETGPRAAELAAALLALENTHRERLSQQSGGDDPLRLVDAYLPREASNEFQALRTKVMDRSFDDLNSSAALETLTRFVSDASTKRDVQFLIATVPDYVDSNSGWVADEVIGAIQAAMSNADYVIDRFRLIDWPRSVQLVATSQAHERQPGAIVFRKVDPKDRVMHFRVVLTTLETPTSGVNWPSLRNAVDFVYRWQCMLNPGAPPKLNVIAPIFSGSITSLAVELHRWPGAATDVNVVSGSAMADANASIMATFAPGVHYRATVQPTSETMRALATTLKGMSSAWSEGQHVALLTESNTAFGQSATADKDNPFRKAVYFRFPLHIAQLRNDAQLPATPAVSLLPAPIVPLSFKEAIPPADQIPAFRPQMTSPVVESIVGSILSDIRQEQLSAVGIVATDARDVLFLAREVKKAAPNVQLFFAGSYSLYLHPDYIPYTRGAIVASPYPLALAEQRPHPMVRLVEREAFASQIAAGVYNATSIQIVPDDEKSQRLLDYCDPGVASNGLCSPPSWISVIGDDRYWPMARFSPAALQESVVTTAVKPVPQTAIPFPFTATFFTILLALVAAAHVAAAAYLCSQLPFCDPRSLLRWPFIRVLAPPITFSQSASLHSISLLFCFAIVAMVASVGASVITLRWIVLPGGPDRRWPAVVAALGLFVLVFAPAIVLVWRTKSFNRNPFLDAPVERPTPPRIARFVVLGVTLLVFGTLCTLAWAIGSMIFAPDVPNMAFKMARLLGGGIVSPAAAALCLMTALYASAFSGLRRLSMVGNGFSGLAADSSIFRLLVGIRGRPKVQIGAGGDQRVRDLTHFVGMLDMPAHHLPAVLVTAIVAVIGVAWWSAGIATTFDGQPISWFVTVGSLSVLGTSCLLLFQAAETWNALRTKLVRLGRTRLEPVFSQIGQTVSWNLSLVPPRLSDLMPIADRVDALRRRLFVLLQPKNRESTDSGDERRVADLQPDLPDGCEERLTLRSGDLSALSKSFRPRPYTDELSDEIAVQKCAPLLQSPTWMALWRVSDTLVDLLATTQWRRVPDAVATNTRQDTRIRRHAAATLGSASNAEAMVTVVTAISERRKSDTPPSKATLKWFNDCEEIVALQCAFLLREILARIMSSLFVTMLCLTLLTGAHLMYVFQGRSSYLRVDLVAIAGASLVAMWIIVGMERDRVLSRLRVTTPERIDLNWDFVKRVTVYGVLPLVAVVSSLFPEVGDSLLGWLEPLKKLTSF
jgi:hypothetical protein